MESSDTKYRGGVARSREEGTVMVLDRRGSPIQSSAVSNRVNGRTDGKMAKSFEITKREVYESYLEVKRNKGCGGVDQVSLKDFETDLRNNLYKLWNRLSSGSYFPPAVRQVEIQKREGGVRVLGIPTVSDRIAQTVIRRRLEPSLEAVFHPDSYGYRPKRSAHDAMCPSSEGA